MLLRPYTPIGDYMLEFMEQNNRVLQPLVSVAVIAYMSSRTVIETLESIKNQSYQNVELIVSDDGSPDDTVAICRHWIEQHQARFIRTELITVAENTGTSANINRAIRASQGDYIKIIAADDLLEPSCIQINLDGIEDGEYAVSDIIRFDGEKDLGKPSNSDILSAIATLPSAKRLKLFCRTMLFFNPPSGFMKATLFSKIGLYDENSTVLEDVPFFVKLFKSDVKVVYIQKVTVRYRQGGISHSPESRVWFQKLLVESYKNYCRPHLSIWNPMDVLSMIDFKFWEWAVYSTRSIWLNLYMSKYNYLHRIAYYLNRKMVRKRINY